MDLPDPLVWDPVPSDHKGSLASPDPRVMGPVLSDLGRGRYNLTNVVDKGHGSPDPRKGSSASPDPRGKLSPRPTARTRSRA
jgi:hypothetical protein